MATQTQPLPACLQRTRGPIPGADDECPICKEPIPADLPTLEHVGTGDQVVCQRRFDEDCLLRWIESNVTPTCPLCRGSLSDSIYWEDEEEDRSELFRDRRRLRNAPEEYFALESPEKIAQVIMQRPRNTAPDEILAHVREEIAKTDDMIDILGLEALQVSVRCVQHGRNLSEKR